MKRYLFIFLLFISTGLYGQIQEHYHDRGDAEPVTGGMSSDLSHPKQVFTPNAANLGVYGKVPVDYYTGTADVQIPLAELKGKDCTQPVYISYRTGGHKVSETPGPFGLGWTLHAGGCINRIVNGEKDELSEAEYNFLTRTEPQSDEYREFVGQLHLSEPGYMYHNNLIQSYSFYIDAFKRPRHYDLAPDEFQICAEGLSGSFYIGRGQKPVLISKAPASYQISYQIDSINTPVALYRSTDNSSVIEANFFTFISKIIITDSEGISVR